MVKSTPEHQAGVRVTVRPHWPEVIWIGATLSVSVRRCNGEDKKTYSSGWELWELDTDKENKTLVKPETNKKNKALNKWLIGTVSEWYGLYHKGKLVKKFNRWI